MACFMVACFWTTLPVQTYEWKFRTFMPVEMWKTEERAWEPGVISAVSKEKYDVWYLEKVEPSPYIDEHD